MRLRSTAVALACAALGSGAAAQAIYRCDDGKGGVLYADAPCRDGAKVDVQSGKADPAAIERLRRDEKAFAERHAARVAKEQADAQTARDAREAQRARAAPDAAGEPQEGYGYPPWAWGGFWPWPPVSPRPPLPPRPMPQPPSPYVPAKPGSLGVPSPPPVAPRR